MDKQTKQAKTVGAMAALGLTVAAALLFVGCGGGGGGGSSTTPAAATPSTVATPTPPAPPPVPTLPAPTLPTTTATTTTPPPPVVNQSQTVSNMKQLGLALLQYVQDYDETFPVGQTTQAIQPGLMPYARDSTVFSDPNTGAAFAWNASLSGTVLAQFNSPATYVTFYDASPPIDNARVVGLLDGHVETDTDAQWLALKASSNIP